MSSQNNTVKEPDSVEGLARNQTGAVNEDCVSSKNRSRKRSLETDASDFDGTCSQDMYSKRSKSAGGTYTYKESQYSPIPEKPKRLLPGFLLESFKDNTNNQCSIKIEEKLSDDFFLTRNKDFRFSSAKKNSVRSFRSETRVVNGQDDDKRVPGFVSQIKNIDYKISKEELCSETQVKTISTRTDGVTHRVIGFLRSETATVSHSEHGRGRIAPISEKKKLESVITEQNSISEEEEDDSESLTSTDVSLPGFLRCISKKRKKGPRSSVQCSAPDSISKIPTSDLPVKSSDAEEEEDDKDSSTSKDAALPGFLRSASKKPKKKTSFKYSAFLTRHY